MLIALVLGAVAGFAALVAWRALVPPTPPLDAVLARYGRADLVAPIASGGDGGGALGRTMGSAARRASEALGLRMDRLAPDLRLVGRSLDRHLTSKVVVALFGLLLPGATAAIAALGGISVGVGLPLVAGLAFGVLFFFVPDLTLRSEADARRRSFRHALGSFLDLVVIGLAGGAGVESALRDAAAIGSGWPFAQLRNALQVTGLTGETPWAALARLGGEIGVGELAELAASVSLAGTEGARVRESLAAKATSLRDHALSAAEAEAQSATERMALPVVLLFVGFLLLIGYPAIDAVLTGI